MEPKEIFISYKSDEFDDALWVKENLEANGISCWMAPMCISGGASYAAEIPAAIQQCEILVLILSQKAQESQWIPRELDQAINLDKLIMPFTIEDFELSDEFNFYLSNVQRYFAFRDREATFEKMLGDVKRYLGKEDPKPAPDPQPEPISKPDSVPNPIEDDEENNKPKGQPKPDPVSIPFAGKPDSTPPKTNNKKEKTEDKKENKGKKPFVIVLAVVVSLVVLIGGWIYLSKVLNEVVIADTVYTVSDSSIHIENKDITAKDIEEFARFEELITVDFKNCRFMAANLSVFESYDLLTLNFENCNLTDAQLGSIDFNAFKHLNSLNISGNSALTNLTVIAPLADKLDNLNISGISCPTDWLKDFTNLKSLNIDKTGITDLSFAGQMIYLEKFSANSNGISNLKGLENTTILEEVSLSDNKLSDVTLLGNSAKTLRKLNLDKNNLVDLFCLAKCTAITDFSAGNNKLTSVNWSSDWNSLINFSVPQNNIGSMLSFSKSKELAQVDFSKNQLTFIGSMAFADGKYVTANFSENSIINVNLPENCNYSKLLLHSNPILDASFLGKIKGFYVSFDFKDSFDYSVLKTSEFSRIYVVDCPANRKVELESISYNVELVSAEEAEKAILD